MAVESKEPLPPGMVLGPDGKPCKVCTGFQQWAGIKIKNKSTGSTDKAKSTAATGAVGAAAAVATSENGLPKDCPADGDRLGRHTWTFLHTTAAYYPEKPSQAHQTSVLGLLKALPNLYPCHTCADHLGDYYKLHPPEKAVKSRDNLEQYLCQVHNEVNERLGKEKFDCGVVGQRWRDGWTDGRCD